ncbi:MAG: hypothetical protein Q8M09_08055 [Pseudomonadota bacterium]|nr:hypothetical protein [Pseudomonadota bacterium]
MKVGTEDNGLGERQTRLRKAVCQSFVRALRRLGMTGRAEILPFGLPNTPPTLFITVERAAVRVSQEAMSVLAREIVGHAKRKYDTELGGVYWRIETMQDHPDGMDDLSPSTAGYLVEESAILDEDLAAISKMLRETENKLNASDHVLSQCAHALSLSGYSRHVQEKTSRRRQERGLPVSEQGLLAADRDD